MGATRSCFLIHDITRSGVVTARCPAPYCYPPPCYPFNPRESLTTPSTLHQRYPCVHVHATCLFTSSCTSPYLHKNNAAVTRLNPRLTSRWSWKQKGRNWERKCYNEGKKKKECRLSFIINSNGMEYIEFPSDPIFIFKLTIKYIYEIWNIFLIWGNFGFEDTCVQ